MVKPEVKVAIHLSAIIGCLFGTWKGIVYSEHYLQLLCISTGFLLGLGACVFGLLVVGMHTTEEQVHHEAAVARVYYCFQMYHVLSWFSLVVGYPTLIAGLWMFYDPGCFEFLQLGLALLPVIVYFTRLIRFIASVTKLIIVLTAVSNVLVCYMTASYFGMAGPVFMFGILLSLTVKYKCQFLGITSRELFMGGFAMYSNCLALSIPQLAEYARSHEIGQS